MTGTVGAVVPVAPPVPTPVAPRSIAPPAVSVIWSACTALPTCIPSSTRAFTQRRRWTSCCE